MYYAPDFYKVCSRFLNYACMLNLRLLMMLKLCWCHRTWPPQTVAPGGASILRILSPPGDSILGDGFPRTEAPVSFHPKDIIFPWRFILGHGLPRTEAPGELPS